MYKFLMALLALSAVGVCADTADRSWVFDTSGDAQGWVQANFSPSGVDGGVLAQRRNGTA